MIRIGLSALCTLMVLPACSTDGPGGWSGTVRDSLGIAIVENPADGAWTLRDRPELVEDLRFGTVEGDPMFQFGTIAALDVDGDGRIYVLDHQAAQVRVFDRDGRFVRTIGKPGQGPGELSIAATAVMALEDGTTYVADLGRQRIVAFGADGEEFGSSPLPLQTGMLPVRWQPVGGRFIIQLRSLSIPGLIGDGPQRDLLVVRDPATETADTLIELRSGQGVEMSGAGALRITLLEPEPVWAVLEDGRVAHARTDAYRFQVHSADGSLERIISRAHQLQPITEADQAMLLELFTRTVDRQLAAVGGAGANAVQELMRNADFAQYYPAFTAALAGPGNTLWVQRLRTPGEVRSDETQFAFATGELGSGDWDVFDEQGRLLGPVRMPDRFTPLRVEGNHIYGIQLDDLDVQYIVRLRLGAD